MMRKLFTILSLLAGHFLSAQNDLKSYQWRDHLPYNQAFSVTNQANTIMAAANECAFSYNKDKGTFERFNKVYGYSDIEPILIKNNPTNNATVIVYKNSNIDVVKNGVVTNVPYLFKKQNTGDKTVNSITFNGPNAYLACGFGIVVLNTDAIQFDEEYIIGPNATYLLIYQVALSNTTIYAATKSGLYQASRSAANLQSFTNWSKVPGIPNGPYNAAVYFGGNIIVNYSKNIQSNANMQDTLFQYNTSTLIWSKYTGKPYVHWPLPGSTYVIQKLSVSDDGSKLLSIDESGFEAMDLSGSRIGHIWDFKVGYFVLYDIIADPTETDIYWAATSSGLIKAKNKPGVDTVEWTKIYAINGPPNNSASSIAIKDDKLVVAPSYLGFDMPNNFLFNGVYHFQDNTWGEAVGLSNDTIVDLNQVVFDNNDKNHYFAGSWWNGVIEYVNDKEVAKYNESNTNNELHLATVQSGVPLTRAGGMAMDKDNNLWVGLGETQYLLSMKKPDNTWMSFDFTHINSVGSTANPPPRISHVIIDSSKQVWCVAYNVGLFVYKIDGNLNQPNGNNAKLINNVVNNGGLPSTGILSIAEDKNGDIWVGTDKGIYVFYNPESIFQQTSGWDAQPIYIEQDGKTQLLLQTDEVVCIAVDGANNKWCGTRNSGIYCFSPDGQKQLFHFTIDNSPIFSNNVVDVKVNPKTGEVFIATDKGLLSFQNTIIEGFDDFKTGGVYAYPNPVKPGYDGPILIHGMVNGATVKIIDAAGNFVYQTTSLGGQAQWNGKNFSGTRVASGVYLVLCSTTDGTMQVMSKILLQN